MDPTQISRRGRGLNLPISNDASAQNTDKEKGDDVIKNTFELLEKGEKEIILDSKHRDVVLILGNTGSGKSTFTQWVAGDNSKMISKETEDGTGEYIIEDHNRIGNSTLQSKTIFPELVVDTKTNAAYYDCPGFSDTQGTSYDIATTYFIKKVVDYSESVKMVFIISHPSVRKGVDRLDFMKLMRHATDLVKDFEKFKHSIAIVATKVDNQYIKQGKDFILVDDEKVIVAIVHFLQEAKQYLEDNSKRPNISEKDNRFYENAIKFVDVLLQQDGEGYPRIGIFRRPDAPGPVSDIPLLQEGKKDIEKIVYERLNFTAKNNEDFGYTVSEKTKNDIFEIIEEINKNLWSGLNDVAGKFQEYYRNVVEKIRNEINSFISGANAVELNISEAIEFRQIFSNGFNISTEMTNNLKNITNPALLAMVINNTISKLDIDLSKDLLYIETQGKYFNFLQTVSDTVLSSKPWYEVFKDVEAFFTSSEKVLLYDVNSAAEKINNSTQIYLSDIVKGIQEDYDEKIKSLEIQKLLEKLKTDIRVAFNLKEEIRNATTTGTLVDVIHHFADNIGVSLTREKMQNVTNQEKHILFLEAICDRTLNVDPIMWMPPFENIIKYFYDSEKWYTFLEDLNNKFSEYDIQKDRQRYNVANLDDWGQPGKPQGISLTLNNFEKFLSKIANYKVSEYESIKNLSKSTTYLQIEELNQILSITLKHRPIVLCSEPHVTVKGSFVSLKEIMQNLMSSSDTNNSCKNFKAQLESRKLKMFQILALHRVFIDADLSFKGKGTSVAIISPKWEIVGSRSIDIRGADGTPHSPPKAKSGAHPGNDGAKGTPGNPGVFGESFFGIGSTFESSVNLKIISNGGKGSRGQDGGDGAKGKPGRNAVTPNHSDPDCSNDYFRGFKCSKLSESRKWKFFSTEITKTYKIHGENGDKGGNGGDGGKAGKGGYPGKIALLELSTPAEITMLTSQGEEGESGKAGSAGQGGLNGYDIIAENVIYITNRGGRIDNWSWKETIYKGNGPNGRNGVDGKNGEGQEVPSKPETFIRPPNIINEYKIFLRENANNRFEKHPLLQFLEQLNNRNDVRSLYDTLALTDEFHGLEAQFNNLSDQMDFSPFYRSLQERISEFAKNQKDAKDSEENRKVLNYLYTATLGRLDDLKENSESCLIIDIRGYLNLIKENIKPLQEQEIEKNKVEVIKKYKANYKAGIDKKIEEAKSLIKEQIAPEIENINSRIDDDVNTLIEETIALQKQAEKDYEKLEEKKRELEKAVALKGVFSFFNIIGGIVSFLGPIGSVAGTVIETTSTVSEYLALDNQKQDLNLPLDVVSAIEAIGKQIKSMRNKKVAYLSQLLDDLSEEIKKNPEKLSDMTDKINDMKDKLKNACEMKMDFKKVKVIENELKGELEKKGGDLKIHSGDKKSIDALKVIEKMALIAQFGSLLYNVYNQVKEDNEKIEAVTDAMRKIENKIRKLREYEDHIYDTIAPMLQEMEDHMKDVSDKLGSKSQVALDVTKWQVQSTLKDMRLQLDRLTEGFEVKGDLSRNIEKLEEVMTTLIYIYDRIQSYQDQQNLANYIADISSIAANRMNITNDQLRNSVNDLEFSISANIVLKQYKSAMDAFKQWVFPFADNYIEKTMLPPQLELDTNIQNLVQDATRKIERMKQKLDLYDASVKNGDQYLECEEFSSRYISSKAFFKWKNEEYRSSISRLLSGKEVVLKADVKKSAPYKDAIKFSEIEFDFKIMNRSTESLLKEKLKAFDIRATHLGSSYYRYANKTFLITSDSVTISYSNERNDDGMPIRSNEVYNKLKSGDLLLSPYTLWEVKLINIPNILNYSFNDLESYEKEVYVELSGLGSYVDTRPRDTYSPFGIPTNLLSREYKSNGLNQCKRSKDRLVRSPEEIVADGDYMTNGAPKGMSSPIAIFSLLSRSYFITNVLTSFNDIFAGQIIFFKNFVCSKLSDELTENRNINENGMTIPLIRDGKQKVTFAEDSSSKEGMRRNSDTVYNLNFDGHNSCSKSFLINDRKDRSNFHSTQAPDLNCSLLLADLVTRTLTGNRYKSPVDECLLSPPEVIFGKISDGVVRSESDIKQMLQRLLSEKEETSTSMFSRLKDYGKSMFQFFGLVGNDDTEKYVQDVRNLFV